MMSECVCVCALATQQQQQQQQHHHPRPNKKSKAKRGLHHTFALPFTLESILRRKKNYRNSNISPCKKL
jgi:hypothetical protein